MDPEAQEEIDHDSLNEQNRQCLKRSRGRCYWNYRLLPFSPFGTIARRFILHFPSRSFQEGIWPFYNCCSGT